MLADAGVPAIELIDPMLGHLVDGLREHNRHHRLEGWLRLRLALHSGEVRHDARSWGVRELALTFRLSQSEAARRCLVLAARAECVLVVSDRFYRSVIADGTRGVDPATYRPVEIAQPGGLIRAWLHAPGYRVPPLDGQPAHRRYDTAALTALRAASRDLNHHHHDSSHHNGGRH